MSMPMSPCRWLGLCLLLACLSWVGGAAAQDGAAPVQRITTLELQQPDGRWQALALPVRWPASQPAPLRLRGRFTLAAAPEAVWALRFDRLPPDHDLRLNGQRLSGQPPGQVMMLPRSVVSQWINVPPTLLRAGENTLELSLDPHRSPAGLSPPWLGPAEAMRADYRLYRLLGESLPFGMNLAVSGLALFALLVWWMRRSERLMGFFGVLMLLVSLRNLGYYTADGVLPSPLGSLVFFLAQGASVALLLGFALVQTTPAPHTRLLRRVLAALALYALAGVLATWQGWLDPLRQWLYPLVIAFSLGSVWRMWRLLAGLSLRVRRGVLVAVGLLLVAAVHDYLFYAGWLPLEDVFWQPYLTPLLMGGVTLMLLQRFVYALDLAERHGVELEQRVAARTRDLQAANAAKTRFVAAASHDLRQPVASIGLLAGLLRELPVLDATGRTLLDRLSASALALDRLLKGLLDLSRFDAGSVDARPRVMPLAPLFDAVAAHEGEAAAAKGLQLRLRDAGLAVRSDPVLLEQIVRNLVSNAVRYTEHGGVLLSARRQGERGVLLQVWDTGVGIAPERQRQVFDEFVQLGNPARDGSRGLGLGLSLVRRAAAVLRAPLALRSVPGRGSCFSLQLPLAQSPQAPAATGALPAQRLDGRRVLVVDDDDGVRETLRLRLESWGAQVQAHAQVSLLEAALQRGAVPLRPHLLVSDQRLPDGDSRDVAAALERRHPGVPVLVITGDTAPADLARLDALGWPVLHKPFDSDTLFSALQQALRRGGTG